MILLRLSGCVLSDGFKAFWRCQGVDLNGIHSVLCKCFDGCLKELCAQAALLDHLLWLCLDVPFVCLVYNHKKKKSENTTKHWPAWSPKDRNRTSQNRWPAAENQRILADEHRTAKALIQEKKAHCPMKIRKNTSNIR